MPDDETSEPGPVPYARFKEVNDKLKLSQEGHRKALAELDTARGELTSATARLGTVDQLTSKLQEMETTIATERAGWKTERALIGAGLTDEEGREVAFFHYGRLPEEGRPEIGAYLEGLKKDPSKAPRSLQPFLGQSATGAEGAGGAGGTNGTGGTKPTLPNAQQGAGHAAPGQTGFGAEDIAKMDLDTYRKNREAVLAQIRS